MRLSDELERSFKNPPWSLVDQLVRTLDPGGFNSYACLQVPGSTYVQCLCGLKVIWTRSQFLRLASLVDPLDRAWIVLQALAGLRPEEAAPKREAVKRGLQIEDIDWRFRVLRVPKEVSKTVANVVPMSDCLIAWLNWAGIREGMGGPCLAVMADASPSLHRRGCS